MNLKKKLILLNIVLQMTILVSLIHELTKQYTKWNIYAPEKTTEHLQSEWKMRKVRIKRDIQNYPLPWIFEDEEFGCILTLKHCGLENLLSMVTSYKKICKENIYEEIQVYITEYIKTKVDKNKKTVETEKGVTFLQRHETQDSEMEGREGRVEFFQNNNSQENWQKEDKILENCNLFEDKIQELNEAYYETQKKYETCYDGMAELLTEKADLKEKLNVCENKTHNTRELSEIYYEREVNYETSCYETAELLTEKSHLLSHLFFYEKNSQKLNVSHSESTFSDNCNDECREKMDLLIALEREHFIYNLGLYEQDIWMSWLEEKNSLVNSILALNNSLLLFSHKYESCYREKRNCLKGQNNSLYNLGNKYNNSFRVQGYENNRKDSTHLNASSDLCENEMILRIAKERKWCATKKEYLQLYFISNSPSSSNSKGKDSKECNSYTLSSLKNKLLALHDSYTNHHRDYELCYDQKSSLLHELYQCLENGNTFSIDEDICKERIRSEVLVERERCSKEVKDLKHSFVLNQQKDDNGTNVSMCNEGTQALYNSLLALHKSFSRLSDHIQDCIAEKHTLSTEKENCLAEKRKKNHQDVYKTSVLSKGEGIEMYLTKIRNQWQQEKEKLLMSTIENSDNDAPWMKEKVSLLDSLLTMNYSLTLKQKCYELCNKELCFQKNKKSEKFLDAHVNRRSRRNKNNGAVNINLTSDMCNKRIEWQIEQEKRKCQKQMARLQENSDLYQQKSNNNIRSCMQEKSVIELVLCLALCTKRIQVINDSYNESHRNYESCDDEITRLFQEKEDLNKHKSENDSCSQEIKGNPMSIEEESSFIIKTDELDDSLHHFYEKYAWSFNFSQDSCKDQIQSLLKKERKQCLQEISGLIKYFDLHAENDDSFSWTQYINEHIRSCEMQKVFLMKRMNALNDSFSRLHHDYKLCYEDKVFLSSQIIICFSEKNNSQNHRVPNNIYTGPDFSVNICNDLIQSEMVIARQKCLKETDISIDLYVKKMNNSSTNQGRKNHLSSCVLELNSLMIRIISLNASFFKLNDVYNLCNQDKEILTSEKEKCLSEKEELSDHSQEQIVMYKSIISVSNDTWKQQVDLQIAEKREYFITNLDLYEKKTNTPWFEEKSSLLCSIQAVTNSLSNLTHEYEVCFEEKMNCLREQNNLRPNLGNEDSDKDSFHLNALFDFCKKRMKLEVAEERKKCLIEKEDLQKSLYSNTSNNSNDKRLEDMRGQSKNCKMLVDSFKDRILALNNSHSNLLREYELCYHQKIILLFELNKCLTNSNVDICKEHIEAELLVEREKCLKEKQDLRRIPDLNAQTVNRGSGSNGKTRKLPLCEEETNSLFNTLLILDNSFSRLGHDNHLCNEQQRSLSAKKETCLSNKNELQEEQIAHKYLVEKEYQWQQEKQNLLMTSIKKSDNNAPWVKEKVLLLDLLLTMNYSLATRKNKNELCYKERAICLQEEKNVQNYKCHCNVNDSMISPNEMYNERAESENKDLEQSLDLCTKRSAELKESLESCESCCEEASQLLKEKADAKKSSCDNWAQEKYVLEDNLESCRKILHELNVSCIEMKTNCDSCYKNNIYLMNRTKMCYDVLDSVSGELNNCQNCYQISNNSISFSLQEIRVKSQLLVKSLESLFFIFPHSNSRKRAVRLRIRRFVNDNNNINYINKDKRKDKIQIALIKEKAKRQLENGNINLNANKSDDSFSHTKIGNHKLWEEEKNLLLHKIQELNQSLSEINIHYNECNDEKTALISELNKLRVDVNKFPIGNKQHSF